MTTCTMLSTGSLAALRSTAFVVAAALAMPAAHGSRPTGSDFSIDWYAIDAGGVSRVHSGCFSLSATTGQPVPGYSAGGEFSLVSGFWVAAPISGADELFFGSFEDCSP